MVKRNICVFVGSRANYSSIKSAMIEIKNHPNLELQVVVGASAILDKYGSVVDLIEKDGFEISSKVHMIIEGENPTTMAKSTGLGLMEFPTVFEQLKPDVVMVVGDRFEIMSAAIAAAYMNIPVAHTMGGEVTGTIDESIRHSVTKLAHIHFPANKDSADRIIKMGEIPDNVFTVGCPRIDLVSKVAEEIDDFDNNIFSKYGGVGHIFDLNNKFVMVSQHPVTTEFTNAEYQIKETLSAIHNIGLPTIMLWPNADAGSDHISRGIRKFRENNPKNLIHLFKNLPTSVYIHLMMKTSCLIGNSSSGIREGEFLGVPCVNIGTRQSGRERGKNVLDVGYNKDEILNAVVKHIEHGKYSSNNIYGDGRAGKRIAKILSDVVVNPQKRIFY